MTQFEMVKRLLKENPNGVCTTTFLKHHIPRFGHHIWTLRNDNWDIETQKCDLENCFHKSQQYKYVWSAIYVKEDNIPNDIIVKPLEKEAEAIVMSREEKKEMINNLLAESGIEFRFKK